MTNPIVERERIAGTQETMNPRSRDRRTFLKSVGALGAGMWIAPSADAFALPENADKGAIRVNGKMWERLHLFQAERTLAIAGAVAAG